MQAYWLTIVSTWLLFCAPQLEAGVLRNLSVFGALGGLCIAARELSAYKKDRKP